MSFFRNKRLFILLIGIIMLVVLIGYSLTDRDDLTKPEQFIQDSVGWVQTAIYSPVQYVTNIISTFGELKDTYSENQVLKEKLSQGKSLTYDVQKLEQENDELKELLDKTESITDFDPIQATVMARSPERWIEQITINKGTEHGVDVNMAVITADGMIGKVQSASNFTSTVQLLTGFDQFNRISATIKKEKGKDIFGLVEEFDAESRSLLFKIIEESDKGVKEGDLVFSSGMGGVFPPGLLIGTVKEVMPDQYGLTNTAFVEPAADMYDINHVIVVDRTLVEKEEQDESKADQEDES